MGVNAWEVIEASGMRSLTPSLDPTDPAPLLLACGARRWGASFRLIELAAEINAAMPSYVAEKVTEALNDAGKAVRGSRVAILGMAYKKDVDDPRASPSFELVDLLLKKGAAVSYSDPHIPSLPRIRHWPHLEPMQSSPLIAEYLAAQDCVLIAVDHTAFDYAFIVEHSRLVIDTRNAASTVSSGREKIVRA
jgi:UDP-N-acetyl-D-glucosamine dehydrogenase